MSQYPCSVCAYLSVVSSFIRATISYTHIEYFKRYFSCSDLVHMSFIVAIWDPLFPLHVYLNECVYVLLLK